MKNLDLRSVLAGALLTMLIVAFTMIATGDKKPREWDYKVLSGYSERGMESTLTDLSSDGWEVVSVSYYTTPNRGVFALLKRPRTTQSKTWWKFWGK